MLITAATLFSSACHSHPFVLFHFAFLLGAADSSTMAWVTCGILVLLALIYIELLSSQTHTAQHRFCQGIHLPAQGIRTLFSLMGCFLACPSKEELLSAPIVHSNASLFKSNNNLTFFIFTYYSQSLCPQKPSLNVKDSP